MDAKERRERNLALHTAARTGDERAFWTLVQENEKLVYKAVARVLKRPPNEDEWQEALISAHDAVRRWEPERGGLFRLFYWKLLRTLRADNRFGIRIPEHMRERIRGAYTKERDLLAQGERPTMDALCPQGTDPLAFAVAFFGAYRPDATNKTGLFAVPDDEEDHALDEHLTVNPEQEDGVDLNGRIQALAEVFCTLPERERRVLVMRFGLNGSERSLSEVGAQLSLSRERVRQIEREVLKTLRARLGDLDLLPPPRSRRSGGKMKTVVVNLRKDEFEVYIGRAGQGREGPWGNPLLFDEPCPRCGKTHRSNAVGRVDLLHCFARIFLARVRKDPTWAELVRTTMLGKRLGCFCAPQPCHGDIYAAWCDGGATAVQELLDGWRRRWPIQTSLFDPQP